MLELPFVHAPADAPADAPARIWVIAELGVNHDGRVERALELVRAAADAGADAVKLQHFRPERLLSRAAGLAAYQRDTAEDVHAMLAALTLSLGEMARVRDAARAAGLAFVVTPFSLADVDELAELGVDAVKIASPDAVNTPLLRRTSRLGVPLLISTGTCDPDELEPAATLLRNHMPGGVLLQCVSSYPTADEHASLGGIAALADRFRLPVGYSDHTTAEDAGGLAVAAGAVVLEKHLTHDPTAAGPDHAASLDPAAMARYVALARRAAVMLGPRVKRCLDVEREVRRLSRQSLVTTRALSADHTLTRDDLTLKRPGTGIPAAELDQTIGRRLTVCVPADSPLAEEELEPQT